MIKERQDLLFSIVTKRVDRIKECLPNDWGSNYNNVSIGGTVEDQRQADSRLPIYKDLPIKHKYILCEPLLESIDLSELDNWIEKVIVGSESGDNPRSCDYNWVKQIQKLCIEKNISFYFKQTGTNFIKDGKLYKVPRKFQHLQAQKAKINFISQDL